MIHRFARDTRGIRHVLTPLGRTGATQPDTIFQNDPTFPWFLWPAQVNNCRRSPIFLNHKENNIPQPTNLGELRY